MCVFYCFLLFLLVLWCSLVSRALANPVGTRYKYEEILEFQDFIDLEFKCVFLLFSVVFTGSLMFSGV